MISATRGQNYYFLFGCAKYIRIKMSFIWPMHVLEFRSSVPLCTLVYKRVLVDVVDVAFVHHDSNIKFKKYKDMYYVIELT